MSILFIISDEFFFTKNIYQFLQTIIKLLNIARSDIYFSEYNDSRKRDNRNPDGRLFNRAYSEYGYNHNVYMYRIKPMLLNLIKILSMHTTSFYVA